MISKQSGFSLIEVLISFVLIGVGALGLVKLQSYLEREADYAIQSVEALRFAEAQLEYLRQRYDGTVPAGSNVIPFSELDDIDVTSGMMGAHCLRTMPGLSTGGFTMQCSFVKPPGALSSSIGTVTVTVDWRDRFRQPHSITLKTMVSKYSEFD